MLTLIVLIWVAVKLQAPLWVYVILIAELLLSVTNAVLDAILKIQKKQLKKAQDELEANLRSLGLGDNVIDKVVRHEETK